MNIQEFIDDRTVYLSPFRGVVVVATNMEEYRMLVELHNLPPLPEGEEVIARSAAFVRTSREKSDGKHTFIMMVNPFIRDLTDVYGMLYVNSAIMHEAQHIITSLQRAYGFTAPNEDEPTAYMIQYLYQKIAEIVYRSCDVYPIGLTHSAYRVAAAIDSMHQRYCDVNPLFVASGMIDHYYQSRNHVVSTTPTGYTATTYWWNS